MADNRDRDKLVPKHPDARGFADEDTPVGVPALMNYADTGTHDIIEDHAAADERLRRRVKATSEAVVETQQIAADTSSRVDDANAGITTLRIEMKNHLVAQDEKIDGLATDVSCVRSDVNVLTAHMDHVRTTTDKILPTLLEQLTKDRDAVRTEDVILRTASVEIHKQAQIAETEVGKQKELAAINDDAGQKEFTRKRDLKIIGIAGTIAAGLVALVELLLHG